MEVVGGERVGVGDEALNFGVRRQEHEWG